MKRLHDVAFTLRGWRYCRFHRYPMRELVADTRGGDQ